MRRQEVGIYIWMGKAYLPVQGRFDSGIWVDLEPVYVADATTEDLASAIEKVLATGHPQLPDPTKGEWQKRRDPVLAATKARNWKALAREGVSYSIGWTEDQIRLDMSMVDNKGRWQFDPAKMRILPLGTSVHDLVTLILEDIKSRPELNHMNSQQ